MSDFLVIAPTDPLWIQFSLEDTNRLLAEVLNVSSILEYVSNKDYFNFSLLLRDGGLIGEEVLIVEALILPTGDTTYPYQFYYKV